MVEAEILRPLELLERLGPGPVRLAEEEPEPRSWRPRVVRLTAPAYAAGNR